MSGEIPINSSNKTLYYNLRNNLKRGSRLITGSLLIILPVLLIVILQKIFASIYGVPPGYTGAPFDGMTCATLGCHRGMAKEVPGWITTNIPSTGYLPTDTYTITLTATRPETSLFGFLITCQEKDWGAMGEFIITDTVETQHSLNKWYVTHKEEGVYGNNQKVWQTDWVAPDDTFMTELGFYAAFTAGIFDVDDEVFTTATKVLSAFHSTNNLLKNRNFSYYPNPVKNLLNILIPDSENSPLKIDVYNLSGVLMKRKVIRQEKPNMYVLDLTNMPSGIMFINSILDERSFSFKVVKK